MGSCDCVASEESKSLKFLYQTSVGRFFLKGLSSRGVSKVCGCFLDSRFSKPLIKSFIRKNYIQIEDYYHDNFHSFNDCFSRKIKEELRPIDMDRDHFISPCDGLLSAYHITDGLVIPVKQSEYSIASLLQNEELAERYKDGICLVFRLCVNHYHRYYYIDSGKKGKNVFIPGRLHTVRPIALENRPVFVENCREYTVMETDHFGVVTQIEVGALLVGKIKNYHGEYSFFKGEEKGMFLYGGSTVILLIEKRKAKIDQRYFDETKKNNEFEVKMGMQLGHKNKY